MAGKDQEGRVRKDIDKQNLVATIQAMANPFEYKEGDLIRISSGCVTPKDTSDHLITVYSIGQNGV